MKYVRMPNGKIEIMEDGDGIPAGAETIFSTDPEIYEGTWETETIHDRADVVLKEGKTEVAPGGTLKSPQEEKLEAHERGKKGTPGAFWTEPHKPHPTDRVCLNCGKKMVGVRPNKKFCSENCRKRYSEKAKRAEKKAVRDFVPHRGPEGQIFYIYRGNIGFIPALWCDTKKKATKFVKDNYPPEIQDIVLEQIKEVI